MLTDLNRKRKKIILICCVCVTLHFSLSVISGNKVGSARATLLGDRSKVPEDAIKNSEMAKQWLEKETKDAIKYWYPVYNLSQHYPVGWIITPITKKIGRDILEEHLDEHRLSLEQVKFRVWAIALAMTFINSFFFGLCLILGWYLVCKTRISITTRIDMI